MKGLPICYIALIIIGLSGCARSPVPCGHQSHPPSAHANNSDADTETMICSCSDCVPQKSN